MSNNDIDIVSTIDDLIIPPVPAFASIGQVKKGPRRVRTSILRRRFLNRMGAKSVAETGYSRPVEKRKGKSRKHGAIANQCNRRDRAKVRTSIGRFVDTNGVKLSDYITRPIEREILLDLGDAVLH